MARWTTLCIVACWLLGDSAARLARPAAGPAAVAARPAAAAPAGSAACLECHESARAVLSGPMATRAAELAFARRAFGAEGDRFFADSCAGCHVSACADCHGDEGHPSAAPADEACLRCHHGLSVGWEYLGRTPREDHPRYRRGATAQGEPYLRMLPDVHHERGLRCADCHPMTSLHGTGNGARGCIECHPSPSREVPEHAIGEHLDKLACVACHAAWAAQEYGTFLVRPDGPEAEAAFAPLPSWGSWKKSAHLKRQDAPPLGLDGNGNVTPIRPRLLLFATDVSRGWENRLLAAEWRPTSPHTVRRGSVACGGCHGNLRRFLLEPDDERLFPLELDGLALRSYWNAQGQSVAGGAFFPLDRYQAMDMKSPTAVREVLRQWQNFLDHAAPRSAR